MKSVIMFELFFALFVICLQQANAQFLTPSIYYEESNNTVTVTFKDTLEKVNTTVIPPDGSIAVDCPDIIYKKSGQPTLVFCDAVAKGNKIELKNFRSAHDPSSSSVNLKSNKNYSILWDKIKDRDNAKALSAITKLELDNNPPRLNTDLSIEKDINPFKTLEITPKGFAPNDLLRVFEKKPNLIKVLYDFPGTDPAFDFETEVTRITLISGTKNLLLTLKDSFPFRPDKYAAVVQIPWKEILNSGIQPIAGFNIPNLENPSKDMLNGSVAITRNPLKAERGKAEYSLEAGFTSTVDPTNRKRNNVGIFGLTVKPSIPIGSFHDNDGDPNYSSSLAFRPLLIADVDTQKVSKSKSPNRIQLGADLEWGNNFNQESILPALTWTNGLRYDSDRDFKLQTMYWRTQLSFAFMNAEESFDFRFFRFQQDQKSCLKDAEQECAVKNIADCKTNKLSRCGIKKEPPVSSYFVRPSLGYDLGGTIRRDARSINAPTKNISRAFFNLAMGIELKRIAKLSVDNTYYYLQNASQRRNRNYLETVFELNTGRLSGIDLDGFSNSIFLKFQRGDQPPTFGSVNAFSLGFKIYK